MNPMTSRGGKFFLIRTFIWAGVLLSVPTFVQVLGGAPFGGSWTVWKAGFIFAAWLGVLLPFAAFAGGLGAGRRPDLSALFLSAAGVAAISFILLGFIAPRLEYEVEREMGLDLASRYPTGPTTIGGLARLRGHVIFEPPASVSFSPERPFQIPANWYTYLIHSSIVLALFAILNAFIGALAAFLTSGLSPPGRRNARWAIGLASGAAFFMMESIGGDWVRASPTNSGVFGAWAPVLLPIFELVLLLLLLFRAKGRTTLFGAESPNG